MKCSKCNSVRIADITGKTADLCHITVMDNYEHDGDVPRDMGIGGGDYLSFSYCLECGQIQGDFPIPTTEVEAG